MNTVLRSLALFLSLTATAPSALLQRGGLAVITACGTGGGGGSVPAVFYQGNVCGTGGLSCTIVLNVVPGDHLIVGQETTSGTGTTLTVSDTKNTFNQIGTRTTQSPNSVLEVWEADNVSGGSTTMTCTNSSGAAFAYCIEAEIRDTLTTSALDKTAVQANATSTSPSSGSTSAISQNAELVMGFMAGPANTPSTIAVQSGFVVPCITATCTNSSGFLPVNYSMGFEYLPVFNGGTQSASFTFGATSPAIVEVFTFK